MSDQLGVRVARIESDVEYIKTQTGNLVVELRRTNDKIDGVRDELGNKIDKKVDEARNELGKRIEGVDKKVDDVRSDLGKKVDDVRSDLGKKVDDVRNDIHSTKVWALRLYITLGGGLLALVAHAFKWI